MGVLMILVGLLGLASGGFKLRKRVRQTIGRSPLAKVEAIAGILTLSGSGLGLSAVRPLAWLMVATTLVLTIVSTWVQARLVAQYVRKREESEALRLKTYLLARKHDEEDTLTE